MSTFQEIDVQALRTNDEGIEVSFTERAVDVLETACSLRADWTHENGFVDESYLIEDLSVVLTSEDSITLSSVEVARLADAASWLTATHNDRHADVAVEVQTDLWAIVANDLEDDK